MSISRKISRNLKENFPNHKRKHNVSLKLWHEVNTKKLEYFLADNKQEPWYGSEVKVLPKPSADGKIFFKFDIELNKWVSFIFSNILCEVLIQNIEHILV